MSSKRVQPQWKIDSSASECKLHLYNSLSRKKELFVPQSGKNVKCYSCGPTVYDVSHMGHARSYISFDILRRILKDYFNFNVIYVMNITDIDDKIIKRARQNYLFDEYLKCHHSEETVINDLSSAFNYFTTIVKNCTDKEKCLMYEKSLHNISQSLLDVKKSVEKNDFGEIEKLEMLSSVKGPFSEYLDSQEGMSIDNNSIFNDLPRKFEVEYFKDMDSLNVLRPDVLTRVSEYIPEIVDYIRQIIDNKYAYESNGSVYFDVKAFDADPDHFYAKLVPEAYGDTHSLQDGEGDLSQSNENEKRSSTDFALWKKSKPGEPYWDSPWSKGRPGWHIECSVMASQILGSTLDIHMGGVDLKFPHHDNEIAQAEAYFGNNDWVRYFLHSGHLTIAGCKMSKSLKNFVTIQDALKKYTARQLRFAFLLHSWKDTLDYSDNTMDMAVSYEKILNEYFLTVKDIVRSEISAEQLTKFTDADRKFHSDFIQTRESVHISLCDNVDTRSALEAIKDCISRTHLYIRNVSSAINKSLLYDVAYYVTRLFEMFGMQMDRSIGFPFTISGHSDGANIEKVLFPYLETLSEFRHNVRNLAIKLKAVDILKECDRLRDEVLPEIGVRLEDREGQAAAVKLVDKNTLAREKEEKLKKEMDKLAEKERKQKEMDKKIAYWKTPPEQIFKLEQNLYSAFDEKGIPTHSLDGTPLSKGQTKKLQKIYSQHCEKYNALMNGISSNGK